MSEYIACVVRKQRKMLLGLLSLLRSFGSQAYGMGPSPFEVGLPISVKPFWKHYHRRIQNCISMPVLNPIKLTMKINHHTY